MNKERTKSKEEIICYHCGDSCKDKSISIDDKYFCCNGCKTVYSILSENNLCNYYNSEETPGIKVSQRFHKSKYDYLDDEELTNKLIDFNNGEISKVKLYIPSIHCSSCIWLLENLYKLNPHILSSTVNFLKKEVSINFATKHISLREIVELLDSIGYEPFINIEQTEIKDQVTDKSFYYKLGLAGFIFGNVMLLSFPEYLSSNDLLFAQYRTVFNLIIFFLSLPLVFYSASEYYISAFKGLRKKYINIDVPITIGIFAIFFKSTYDMLLLNQAGYFDSLAGLVFFLLLGKLFQQKTYDRLNFERNYKSYFPISVTVKKGKDITTIPLSKLKIGDRIIVRNHELVPADSVLISENANIDYSFVTGESIPEEKKNGDLIFAGGKQIGKSVELEIIKDISQSYLTQLWNENNFSEQSKESLSTISDKVSKIFTVTILSIAIISYLAWLPFNSDLGLNAFISVLIVACPCALALSIPFTLGNSLRIFGYNGFYLKNTSIIEKISKVKHLVFDKTGTITNNNKYDIEYVGEKLSDKEKAIVKGIVYNSSHPLSRAIYNKMEDIREIFPDYFEEHEGLGLFAKYKNIEFKIGSYKFMNLQKEDFITNTEVFVKINDKLKGSFKFKNEYRNGLKRLVDKFKKYYTLYILSGDNESEMENLNKIFGKETKKAFNLKPMDKLEYIKSIQQQGGLVLMFGDGLNDAGALRQSDIGIAVTEDTNNFSPACDAILDSKSFDKIDKFLDFSKTSIKIIKISFTISFIYNILGISYAVSGNLSPLVAAVLMPLSSISVVLFTTITTNFLAKKKGLL